MDIRDFILEEANERVGHAKEHLSLQRKVLRRLQRMTTDEPMEYEVELVSLWANEGEKGVMVRRKGSLESIMKEGIQKFMEVNNRGDVQAAYRVAAIPLDGVKITIPQIYWTDYEYKRPSRSPQS